MTDTHTPFKPLGLAAAALLAATLAACGGGGDDGPASPGTPGTPAPQAGSSAECATPVGTRYNASYRLSNAGNGAAGTVALQLSSDDPDELNGVKLLRQSQLAQFSYTAGPNAGRQFASATVGYYTQEHGTADVVHYADANSYTPWDRLDAVESASATVYSPPWIDRLWSLTPGQTSEVRITGTEQVQTQGQAARTAPVDYIRRTTYHGQETVDTPAGRYTACHFTYTMIEGNSRSEQHSWQAKGSGVLVKQAFNSLRNQATPDTMELTQVLVTR